MVLANRLTKITKLDSGSHRPDGKYCLMEAVAFVAGEPWSDSPACACPVLAAYGRALNDAMPDEQRQRLIPLIPKLVGTRATREIEQRRAYLLADVAVRVLAPIALRAAKLDTEADKLAALPEITNESAAEAAMSAAVVAASAAESAWSAAVVAASAAESAWSAARSAAEAAARSAAESA